MPSITHHELETQLTLAIYYALGYYLAMFAAIAYDGTRDVVVGTGPTEASAREDAKYLLDSMKTLMPNDPLEIKRVVPITDAQAKMHDKGVNDCLLLKIPDSV